MTKKYYGGAMNVNRNKTNDKAPDLKGDIEISPEHFEELAEMHSSGQPISLWLSAWVRESPKGKFYSVSCNPKKPMGAGQGRAAPAKSSRSAMLDDDIPF